MTRASAKKPVRVGIIGLGAIAERAHLPHFAEAPGCSIVAVSSSRPRVARAIQKLYGIARYFADWRDLVASDEIDAVSVCSINDEHAIMTVEALRHGKHVLVEKPIATTKVDALRMVARARAERRVLAVHHHLRFAPAAMVVRDLLEQGRIGDVVAFEGTFCHRGPRGWAPHAKWFFDAKRVGGGVIMDLGVHAFDLLRHWLADDVRAVSALSIGAAEARGGSAEHHASCLLAFRKGAIGTVTVSWRDGTYRNHWHLIGSRGAIDVDLTGDSSVLLQHRGTTKRIVVPRRAKATVQGAFIEQIRSGRREAAGLSTGHDGERALSIALACGKSARLVVES